MSVYKIGEQMLTLSVISEIIEQGQQLELGKKAKQKIQACRDYLDDKIILIDSSCKYLFDSIKTMYDDVEIDLQKFKDVLLSSYVEVVYAYWNDWMEIKDERNLEKLANV